jgi:hypothetical protein
MKYFYIFVKKNKMAEKKFFVDINLQSNNINNLKADTLDITTNLASANTKRIVYHNGSYYYSDGTSWNTLGFNYNPESSANKSTSTSLGTSDTLYPTQNAVKVYADNLLGNANALVYKGTIDCSTNPDYPAADAGWMYIASVSGKIGGASGVDVEVGDMIICNTDSTVTGNQAAVGQYWNVIQKNIVGAVTGPASSLNNTIPVFDGVTGKIIKQGIITDDGTNIGVGTTSPLVKFHVRTSAASAFNENIARFDVGDDTSSYFRIANAYTQDAVYGALIEGKNSSTYTGLYVIGNGTTDTGSNPLMIFDARMGSAAVTTRPLFQWSNFNTAVMTMTASGNLGLGTTAPGAKLDINGNLKVQTIANAPTNTDKFLVSDSGIVKYRTATQLIADILTVTNTGTNGAATLTGNTLNIPVYESSLIPKLQGNEIWRGHTFRNNSTTFDSSTGLTLSTSGTNTARSVATTSYATKSIRMGVTASIVGTGRYSGIRGGVLLWYVTGGFMYIGEFNISDTATATGTHNFWGLASSTSDLLIGGISNDQPSALTNIIAFANDSGDANLQIMHNDASGTATKIDLGASFPSNRTAGAAITTIYSCYLYNAPGSTDIIYRIVNKETGAVAQGTLNTNLPASTVGLNFFGARTMGTSGGGITNSGQFDVYRLGVYSL